MPYYWAPTNISVGVIVWFLSKHTLNIFPSFRTIFKVIKTMYRMHNILFLRQKLIMVFKWIHNLQTNIKIQNTKCCLLFLETLSTVSLLPSSIHRVIVLLLCLCRLVSGSIQVPFALSIFSLSLSLSFSLSLCFAGLIPICKLIYLHLSRRQTNGKILRDKVSLLMVYIHKTSQENFFVKLV